MKCNMIRGGWSLNPPNPKFKCWICNSFQTKDKMNTIGNYCLQCYKEMKV